jgi:plasmid stability protein
VATLNIKNLPDRIYRKLQARAKRERRSVAQEVTHLLDLRAAAELRAATGIKTPDALQLVAAIGARCRTFLTDDRRLPSVPGLRVRQLSASLA